MKIRFVMPLTLSLASIAAHAAPSLEAITVASRDGPQVVVRGSGFEQQESTTLIFSGLPLAGGATSREIRTERLRVGRSGKFVYVSRVGEQLNDGLTPYCTEKELRSGITIRTLSPEARVAIPASAFCANR